MRKTLDTILRAGNSLIPLAMGTGITVYEVIQSQPVFPPVIGFTGSLVAFLAYRVISSLRNRRNFKSLNQRMPFFEDKALPQNIVGDIGAKAESESDLIEYKRISPDNLKLLISAGLTIAREKLKSEGIFSEDVGFNELCHTFAMFGAAYIIVEGVMGLSTTSKFTYKSLKATIIAGAVEQAIKRKFIGENEFLRNKCLEIVIRILEEKIGLKPSSVIYYELSEAYSQRGRLYGQLTSLVKGMNMFSREIKEGNAYYFGGLLATIFTEKEEALMESIADEPNNKNNHISLAHLYLRLNQKDRCMGIFEDAKQRFGSDAEFNAIYALTLDFIGEKEKAKRQWQDTISSLQPGKFEVIGEWRNEVVRYSQSSFVGDLLIFKRNRKSDNLGLEEANLAYLNRHFAGRVSRVLATAEQDELFNLVLLNSGNITLYQNMFEGKDDSEYKPLLPDCISLLSDIQAKIEYGSRKGDIALEDILERENGFFTRRIREVFIELSSAYGLSIPEEAKRKILENHKVIEERLLKAERAFYKDANPMNWLVSYNDVTAIDFESNYLMPAQLDLVSLLEFGETDLTEEEKRRYIEKYAEKREKSTGRKIDREKFYRDYDYAAYQRHLELAGYTSRDIRKGEWYIQARKYHIERARFYLTRIMDLESDRIRANALKEIKEGLDLIKV